MPVRLDPSFTAPGSPQSGLRVRLRAARMAAGLTQAQVATRAGLHRSTVADLEGGRREGISMSSAQALARALGVSVCDFIAEPVESSVAGTDHLPGKQPSPDDVAAPDQHRVSNG